MAKLIMSLEGSVLREIPLDKESLTIGRKATNDLQIDNLAVSGEHARIFTMFKHWVLEDLGSTNGTLVNGAPVKQHNLETNDLIAFGKYTLKFIGELPAPQPAAVHDMEKTMLLRPGDRTLRPAASPAANPAARPAAQPAARPAAQPAARPAAQPVARPVTVAPAQAGMLQKLGSWFRSWFN
jgi:pSer/pThr/pTyr-binding forkhead associated (FHA) protein